MSIYAIGDVQGCFDALGRLIDKIRFDPKKDQLWLAGDLVNRGPESLETLRFVKALGNSARTVLGNHDLHALAVWHGIVKAKSKDTLQTLFQAQDCAELMQWLSQQPLAIYDEKRKVFLSHAGIPPQWSIKQARKYAAEIEAVVSSKQAEVYYREMYGNSPDKWSKKLKGFERLRCITNYYTRMRFIDKNGRMEFKSKLGPESAPKGYAAWYSYPREDKVRILFGHWAALMGRTGSSQFVGLDMGCVWGGELLAYDIDKQCSHSVPAKVEGPCS